MLDSMTSWVTLTPATLFLFINLVIGTILVASRFGSHHRPPPPHHHQQENDHHHQYQPSLLERVRSGNFPFYGNNEYPAQALQRSPSLLQRVKSFDFSSYYRSDPQPGFTHEHDSYNHTGHATETSAGEPEYEISRVDPPKLERVPSLLQRVKSIKLPSLYRYDAEAETGSDLYEEQQQEVTRSKTEGKKRRVAKLKMKKSASVKMVETSAAAEEEVDAVERRRPTTTRVEKSHMFEDEEVDAKADDFINRFKQQLKLQRLDSLLRYR